MSMNLNFTLELDRYFRRAHQLNILSNKFRILLYVMSSPGCSIKDAQAESGLSYRGFQMKLGELLEAKLITLDDDPSDGRRKRMNVGPRGLAFEQHFRAANSGCVPVECAEPGHDTSHVGE